MLRPTWRPPELDQWTAPGGPLEGTGTLADLWGRTDGRDQWVDADERFTGADMAGVAAALAAWLAGAGVAAGDAVAWQLSNRWEAVALYRACWRLGAVAAPLHHLAGDADVAQLVEGLDPALVLSAPELPAALLVGTRPVDDVFAELSAGAEDPAAPAGPEPGDVAVVLHTSGSSGRPKGVLHTHRSLAHKARLMAEVHGLGEDDVVLMPAPLAHVSGLLNGILVPAAAGMRTVLMRKWSPEEALRLIETERVTFMVGPPTFFIGLEQAGGFSPARVASLRLLSVGGAGVTPTFVEHTTEVFGAEVKRTYGSTEAPTVTTAAAGDDDHVRARTDGRPVGAVRLRIVDPATAAVAAVGRPGEVQVSGPELFAGYTDPTRTAEAVAHDGGGDWFRTGDLGVIDADGCLTITGRLNHVIIRGGENIDTAEVEAHLVAHPAVRHAVVVGEPDERLGERVCAVIELVDCAAESFDLEECRRWFAERGVARFRTPERIVVVDAIPLLASGKADRVALAKRL